MQLGEIGELGLGDTVNTKRMNLARPAGFEPTTPAFGGQYSIQLSYGRMIKA